MSVCTDIRHPVIAGRTVLPDDTYLVSYPKSGNTWLRYMLTLILSNGRSEKLCGMENFVPDIYRHNDDRLQKSKSPRILKSHEGYTPAYRRVIYLVRDPRSVAVSFYWHQQQKELLKSTVSLSEFMPSFLEPVQRWGNWGEHVSGWLDGREYDVGFYCLKYEDMVADPVGELRRLLMFMDVDAPDWQLEEVVCKSELLKLRQREDEEQWAENRFPVRRDISFFRKGLVDEWRQALCANDVSHIETAFAEQMTRLGYAFSDKGR